MADMNVTMRMRAVVGRSVERGAARVGAALRGVRRETDGSARAAGRVGAAMRRQRAETTRTARATTDLARDTDRLTGETRGLEHASARLGAAQRRLARDTARVGDMASRAAGRLGKLKAAAVAGAGIGLAAGAAYRRSMDVEEEQRFIEQLIGAEGADRSLRANKAFVRRADTRATLAEMQGIAYQLLSAGLSEEEGVAGSQAVHRLAVAGRADPTETAAVVGTLVNNFGATLQGTTEERLGNITHMMLRAQQREQISGIGVLGEGLSESASSAQLAKLPLNELLAGIGLINTAGKTGSEAGTAMKAALDALPKASAKLGFQTVRREDKSLDLAATLANLEKSLAGMDTDARQLALTENFGEGKDALVPIMAAGADFGAFLKELAEAEARKLAERDYARMVDTDRGRWESLKENVALVFQELAEANADVLEGPMAALTDYAARLGATLEENPALAKGAGTAVAAAGVGVAGYAAWNAGAWLLGRGRGRRGARAGAAGGAGAALGAGGLSGAVGTMRVGTLIAGRMVGGGMLGGGGRRRRGGRGRRAGVRAAMAGAAGSRVGGAWSRGMRSVARRLPFVGGALGATFLAADALAGDLTDAGDAIKREVGALGGGALGALIGSMILPGVGTLVGGVIGSLAGEELGDRIALNNVSDGSTAAGGRRARRMARRNRTVVAEGVRVDRGEEELAARAVVAPGSTAAGGRRARRMARLAATAAEAPSPAAQQQVTNNSYRIEVGDIVSRASDPREVADEVMERIRQADVQREGALPFQHGAVPATRRHL